MLDVPIGTVMSRIARAAPHCDGRSRASRLQQGGAIMTSHISPEMLAALADGEFQKPELLAIQEHLAGCAACTSSALAQTLLKSSIARAGQRYAMPPELAARVSQQIARERSNAQPSPRPHCCDAARDRWICRAGLGNGCTSAGGDDTLWKLVPDGTKRSPESDLGLG